MKHYPVRKTFIPEGWNTVEEVTIGALTINVIYTDNNTGTLERATYQRVVN